MPEVTAAKEFDVLVLGGGPAGAATAWSLATAGVSVLLVDDGRHRPIAPRETLLAASQVGLERSGLWPLVAAAAVADPLRHGAIWGSAELRWRDAGAPGLWYQRGVFDAALRRLAAAAGAVVCEAGAWVPQVCEAGGAAHGWLRDAAGARREVAARFLVLATGRRRLPEPFGCRVVQRGPATAALTLRVPTGAGARCAVVEAVPQGWWWWQGDGVVGGAATLLCDADELRQRGAATLVAAARAAASGPVQRLGAGPAVAAGDATARLQIAERGLLVGDAAATIDPLASQGTEKALLAAEHAALVVRTALAEPSWWPELRRLHQQWEHGLAVAHGRTAAHFAGLEDRFGAQPFWVRRRLLPTAVEPPREARLALAPGVALAAVLARTGPRIERVAGLRRDPDGATVAAVGFVPAAPVAQQFRGGCTIAAAVAAAGREPRLHVLGPAAVEAAAVQLCRDGWLAAASAS